MNECSLSVKMLGSFAIKSGSKTLMLARKRESRMLHLLQYLLYNYKNRLPALKLADIIYEDEEIDNPIKAIQVLITRLRQALLDAGLPPQEYIQFAGGMYGWNPQVPCRIDAYEYEEAVKQARMPGQSAERKLEMYSRAAELYDGDFLPDLSGHSWVTVVSAYYSKLFVEIVEEAWEILSIQNNYTDIHSLCSKGLSIYPAEERLHIIKIDCLIKENRLKEALAAYNAITELLLNEWGVGPSEDLQELYREITARYEGAQLPLNRVRNEIAEETNKNGAYFSPLASFIDSYHLMLRVIERSGQSVFLMLCDLIDTKGNVPEPGKTLADAAACLSEAIRQALRRGDLFTRYNTSQFLVLLIGTNIENCTPIADRITSNYKKHFKGRGIHIRYSVLPASDIDFSDKKISFAPDRSLWGSKYDIGFKK